MYDKEKIIPGILIFLVVVTFPIWYSLASGSAGKKAEPKLPPAAADGTREPCVESAQYMREYHMDLLDEWRDAVVRDGYRIYISDRTGKAHEMSLSKECMRCHTNKAEFCDECHDYAGVEPDCWNCHVEPAGGE